MAAGSDARLQRQLSITPAERTFFPPEV